MTPLALKRPLPYVLDPENSLPAARKAFAALSVSSNSLMSLSESIFLLASRTISRSSLPELETSPQPSDLPVKK